MATSTPLAPGAHLGPDDAHPRRRVVIRPTSGWRALGLRELWEARELLFFLVWRDVKVRYKQTVFGAAWAVLQPLSLMLVFAIFLGHFLKVPSDGVPYPLFAFSALLPWTFFAQSLAGSSNSLITNANLLSKVYFPRLVLPLAAAGSFLLDLAVGLVVLLGMMLAYGVTPDVRVIAIPGLVLLTLVASLAAGLWLSAISARYRDVVYGMPLLVQLWLFASPIAYSSSLVPHAYRPLYAINPMVGVIEGFRWALLGRPFPGTMLAVSAGVAVVVAAGGLVFFRRTERTFADVI